MSAPKIGPCFYFGCVREAGHYLHSERLSRIHSYDSPWKQLGHFDGALPYPQAKPYVASLSRLWGLGYSSLSFWDHTVDERGGSNSNFFIPEMNMTPEQLLGVARERFPSIFARLPTINLNRAIRDLVGPEAFDQLMAKN